MEAVHFFNGDYVSKDKIQFSIDDVGVIRGFGVFDYLRVEEGVPLFIEDHLVRFERSAKLMGIQIPYSGEELEGIIQKLISTNNFDIGAIKMVLTGGDSPDGFSPGKPNLAILNLEMPNKGLTAEEGVSLMLHDFERPMATAKSTDYAMAVSLQSRWLAEGHVDVLYHHDGYISELSRRNLFMIDSSGTLVTNEEGILHGISRMKMLEIARKRMEVEIRAIQLDEIFGAKELFMTSSNGRVVPVVRIEDKTIGDGQPGKMTQELAVAFGEYVQEYIKERRSAQSIS